MRANEVEKLIENLSILVVDESQFTRRLTRMMLQTVGAKNDLRGGDGVTALDFVRTANPDMLIMEWVLPVLSGPQVMRIVRSPEVFPKPHLPIILLTSCAQRQQVNEAVRLGVHEFLVKPTSPRALARPHDLDPVQATPDGADRQVLRSYAARDRRAESDRLIFQSPPDWRSSRRRSGRPAIAPQRAVIACVLLSRRRP